VRSEKRKGTGVRAQGSGMNQVKSEKLEVRSEKSGVRSEKSGARHSVRYFSLLAHELASLSAAMQHFFKFEAFLWTRNISSEPSMN
jgi:hypothetical protein